MQRILVTGADGFVGRWAMDALAAQYTAADLVVTTRGAMQVPPGVIVERLDVTDAEAVKALLSRHRPNGVLHLAGISAVCDAEADVRRAYEVNLYGALHLADAIVATTPEARLVHVSSADIYGAALQADVAPLAEDAAIAPLNAYSLSKAAGDLAIGARAVAGLRAMRLRPFNHAGPGQDSRFVISAFARQIADIEAGRRSPVLRVGDLSSVREFIDVRDIARAYALAFGAADEWWNGSIVNLAGGRRVRIGDMLEMLLLLSTAAITVEQDAGLTRPAEMGYAGGNAERAATALGWHPSIPFETTLADTLAFWRSRDDGTERS